MAIALLRIVLGTGALKFCASRPMMELNKAAYAPGEVLAENRGGELPMSIAGIASSSIFQLLSSQSTQSPYQNFKQEFQQLGQALQSGNLTQAQSDFAALQPSSGQSTATSTQTNASPIATAFQQLSQDLQSGNLTAAQQDYSTIQQDFQQQAASGASGHAHHHHHHSGGSQDSSSTQNTLSQLFSQLGQALQGGNLSSAQSAYASLQQDLTQLSGATGIPSSGSSNLTSASNPLSVSV
jgi:outer membrane protein assembly factor BamD (BamD/ComL family)